MFILVTLRQVAVHLQDEYTFVPSDWTPDLFLLGLLMDSISVPNTYEYLQL